MVEKTVGKMCFAEKRQHSAVIKAQLIFCSYPKLLLLVF